jgi:hypothetical protein
MLGRVAVGVLLMLALVQLGVRWNPIGTGDDPSTGQDAGWVSPIRVGDLIPDVPVQVVSAETRVPERNSLRDWIPNDACVLVYFFDPACGACQVAAPDWNSVPHLQGEDTVIPILWVNIVPSAAEASRFKAEFDLRGQLVYLGTGASAQDARITGVPTVWGVSAHRVAHLSQGVMQTSPGVLPTEWCEAEL